MSWKEELEEQVREATRSYIESVAEDGPDTVPEETLYTTRTGLLMVGKEEIAVPSRAIESDPREYSSGEFEPVAEHIVEELDIESISGLVTDKGLLGEDTSDAVEAFEVALMKFAGLVMDYVGEFEFQDDAFEAAYEENFYPRYTDYDCVEILAPVEGVVTDETVTLDDDLDLDSEYSGPYSVESIEISPISDKELDGMVHFDEGLGTTAVPRVAPGYNINQKLRFEIRRRPSYREFKEWMEEPVPSVSDTSEVSIRAHSRLTKHIYEELTQELIGVAERIVHLHSPDTDPAFQNPYIVVPGFLSYRSLAVDVADRIMVDTHESQGSLAISSEWDSKFDSFWSRYAPFVTNADDQFSKPLVRFEEMFRKERLEDQFLDCAIALERTLLTGTHQGSSYTFRMGLRGSLLLAQSSHNEEWGRDSLYQFLKGLYEMRSHVVHSDASIAEAMDRLDDDTIKKFDPPEQLLTHSRKLLAKILLSYMDLSIDHDLSTKQANIEMDKTARHASFIP